MPNRLGLMQSLGRIYCVGAPYHGRLVNTTLTNEVDASTMAYPHNASANWVNLVEVPEAFRGPERTAPESAADAALGHVYKDHAFIVGLQRRIHGITLGVDNWLYIDTTGKAWRVIIPDVTPTTSVIPSFDLEFERFGLITDAALETKTVTVASIASGQSTAPTGRTSFGTMNVWDFTKTGNKAVLSIYQSAEHPVGFVELTITDDGEGNFSASQSVYKTRSEMLHTPTDTGAVITTGGDPDEYTAGYRTASMRRGVGARYDASGTLEFIEMTGDYHAEATRGPNTTAPQEAYSLYTYSIALLVDNIEAYSFDYEYEYSAENYAGTENDTSDWTRTIDGVVVDSYTGSGGYQNPSFTFGSPQVDGWMNENADGESSIIEEGNSYHIDGFKGRRPAYGLSIYADFAAVRKFSNKVYGIVYCYMERRNVLGTVNDIFQDDSYFEAFRYSYLNGPDGYDSTPGYNQSIADTWNDPELNAAYNPKTHEILLAGDDTASYTDTIGWV